MVDTGIFATTQEVQDKAGANASSTANTEAYINRFIAQAESQINVDTEYNWSDAYAALDADVKKALTKAAASLAAIEIINYDPSSWTLTEATFKINVLYTQYQDIVKVLREKDKSAIFAQEA